MRVPGAPEPSHKRESEAVVDVVFVALLSGVPAASQIRSSA
jgi:hypothetical protein